MAAHNLLGKQGEDEACYYLIERDIHILERNWHGEDCEIDIIAEHYGMIIFIEVKTRTSTDREMPEDAVDANRMYRMSRAAEEYLQLNMLAKNPYRFDIIALDGVAPSFNVRHIVDAFDLKARKFRRSY